LAFLRGQISYEKGVAAGPQEGERGGNLKTGKLGKKKVIGGGTRGAEMPKGKGIDKKGNREQERSLKNPNKKGHNGNDPERGGGDGACYY